MKTLGLNRILSLFFLMSGCLAAVGQVGQSEVPGDHFSLQGALELFKKSTSPEEFERLLNSPNAKVNNLDLNGDGYTDYIKVIDRNEGNVHAFILRAIISEIEDQDVAVIELEKLDNGKAILQITGDEDIYAIETIIEPTEEVRVNAGTSTVRTVVNVWTWPSVRYVYSPYYSGWTSPWRWSMRPVWWHTWRPVAYYEYNPWWQSYQPYYSTCHTHRVGHAQRIYRPVRTTSVIVHHRHTTQISHHRSTHHGGYHNDRNNYDNERSRFDDRSNAHPNNTNRNVTNGGNWSGSSQYGNSRSSANTWSQHQNNPQWGKEHAIKKPSAKRNEFSFENRPATGVRSTPNVTQQNFTREQRDNLLKKRSSTVYNNDSHQQVTRPVAPIDRRGLSGNPNIHRPSNGGNNKSSDRFMRGRN